jgi:hypothetical protein
MNGGILSGAAISFAGLAAAGVLIALRYVAVRAALSKAAALSFKRRAALFLCAGGLAGAALGAFSGSLALPAVPALILGVVAFRAFMREAGKGEP